MKIVALDTSIYKQLGYNFSESIIYKDLQKFISVDDSILGMVDVVKKEFINHFANYIQLKLSEYSKIKFDFQKTSSLPVLPDLDIINIEQIAVKGFVDKVDLTVDKLMYIDKISTDDLVSFCISAKDSKKNNTRDYLIFKTLLAHAKEDRLSKYIFIVADGDFKPDGIYDKMLKDHGINNLFFYESINQYLSKNGYQVPYITEELIMSSIDSKSIENEILVDITALPSYICDYYYDLRNYKLIPKLEELKITSIDLLEYYTIRDQYVGLKVISTFDIGVYAMFEPDKNKDLTKTVFDRFKENDKSRIDHLNRPIYENTIFFVFEGLIDEKTQTIKSQRIEDWQPNPSYGH